MSDQTTRRQPNRSATADGSSAAPTWSYRDDLVPFTPLPGFTVRVVAGERLMAAWIGIEPETALPLHHHPHEQLGVVLEGAIEVTVGEETRRLGPGGAYVVPPDVPHGGKTGPEGCLVLETFSPPREDYLARSRQAAADSASPED